MECTQSFTNLLSVFQCVFTAPTFPIFVNLMTGWILTHRRRFVTDLMWSSGSTRRGHYCRYHRFFSQSAWALDSVSWVLAKVLINLFAPTGIVYLAVDDTLCRKRGLTVYGTGMHHDPLISSRKKALVSWGHDWVVKRKPDPNHRTRPELAVELISLIAGWFSGRIFVVSGDSAYGGASVLKKLPANVELISHVHPKGALYTLPPPPVPGQIGCPRKKGQRLPGMGQWADDPRQPWKKLVFDQFGLHATLLVKTQQALYYKAGGRRLLTIVLVRDVLGQRPDQMFYCTRLDWDAHKILSTYASRWSIEVTFENSKQLLGLGDPANRKEKAVHRTAPMALVLFSLIVAWFHQVGHRFIRFPDRPWYRQKREPSFADMLTTLRRKSWLDYFHRLHSKTGGVKKCVAQIIEFLSLSG